MSSQSFYNLLSMQQAAMRTWLLLVLSFVYVSALKDSRKLADVPIAVNHVPNPNKVFGNYPFINGKNDHIGTEQLCKVCKRPVRERTVQSQTPVDAKTIAAFACEHHKNMHNNCFTNYILVNAKRELVGCPVCNLPLKLYTGFEQLIDDQRTEMFKYVERLRHGVLFDLVLKRWPRILEVGNVEIACTRQHYDKALQCAYIVLRKPDLEEYLSKFMENYIASYNHLREMDRGVWMPIRPFFSLKLYSHYGEEISLQKAVELTSRSAIGEIVLQNLYSIRESFLQISVQDESHSILDLPEIWAIREENMYVDGKKIDCSILRATHLLQVPMLQTKIIRESIHAISDAFVAADKIVDDYILQHWPNLANFKKLGMWHEKNPEHHSIRYLAKMAINTIFPSEEYKALLDQHEAGALEIQMRVVKFSKLSFQGLQYLKQFKMKNSIGGITAHTALMFAMHPDLAPEEREEWMDYVNKNLFSILTSLQSPASRIAQHQLSNLKLQSRGKSISAIHQKFNEVLNHEYRVVARFRRNGFNRISSQPTNSVITFPTQRW